LTPHLVRGLDYYTRTTFEITSTSLGAQDALCGGGRYDRLVETLGGKPTAGIGFAAGMERILLALGENNISKITTQVYIIGLGDAARTTVIKLTEDLRKNNIRTDFDVLRRSVKAQMRDANKGGAQIAIIIGDQELEQEKAGVKNLYSGEQDQIAINKLVNHINSLHL
jgi:histidyl-tRNA synthetase